MAKVALTVFICTQKDCRHVWRHVDAEMGMRRWIKKVVSELQTPARVEIIETECMDRCDEGGCLFVAGPGHSGFVTGFDGRSPSAHLRAALSAAATLPTSCSCWDKTFSPIPSGERQNH
jgi:predicted metal-binding protein